MSRRIITTVSYGLVVALSLVGLPAAVMARGGGGGGHGGGGHGGHGGGHHGGGHHGGGHHYGGGRSHSYGGSYAHRSYAPSYHYATPSYAHSYRAPTAVRSYSYGGNSFTNRHGVTSSARVVNTGNSYRHYGGNYRYRYPYNTSYFFGYNSPFGLFGYGGYGLGGYGYGGYGYGNYSTNYAYQPVCSYGGYPLGVNGLAYNQAAYPATAGLQAAQSIPSNATIGGDALQGELDFKAGNYAQAEQDWRHALVDDPNSGALTMLLAQAMFANGKFDEAAGAVQRGMQMLPQDKWGVVVSNYAELYRGNQDYTDQLRKLEAARNSSGSPAVDFLLGYHYGYLGYPQNAVVELDKVLKSAPQDDVAKRVRDIMAAKLTTGSSTATP